MLRQPRSWGPTALRWLRWSDGLAASTERSFRAPSSRRPPRCRRPTRSRSSRTRMRRRCERKARRWRRSRLSRRSTLGPWRLPERSRPRRAGGRGGRRDCMRKRFRRLCLSLWRVRRCRSEWRVGRRQSPERISCKTRDRSSRGRLSVRRLISVTPCPSLLSAFLRKSRPANKNQLEVKYRLTLLKGCWNLPGCSKIR